MHRPTNQHRLLQSKRKTPSLKSADNLRKSKNSRCFEGNRKIPQIINELEQNLSLLKRYYYEDHPQKELKITTKRPSRTSSANGKHKTIKVQQKQLACEEQTTLAEIDDLKKSFLSMHGYETNNIVELYNFYKKNLEKSTRLFGSTSMSNMINLTQNHSQIRDRGVRPNSGYIISHDQDEPIKDKEEARSTIVKADAGKLPLLYGEGLVRNAPEMVNVATLLADKKKISRRNICENMNSQNLLNQAKRKLYRPNPNDNIQKFCKMKENLRNQNIRISPGRKFRNIELGKQKSSSRQASAKKQEKLSPGNKSVLKSNKKSQQKQIFIEPNAIPTEEQPKTKTQQLKSSSKKHLPTQQQKQSKQVKQLKSAKSSRSIKSIKSPNSIRSPSLNQAILLDLTISAEPSSRKKVHPSYFVPRVHTTTAIHDSLLDCEITPKEISRVVDLEAIPFDF